MRSIRADLFAWRTRALLTQNEGSVIGRSLWNMAREYELLRRLWAFGTAVVGFAMVAIYVSIIVGEGVHSLVDVLPWVTAMAAAAITAFAGAHIKDRRIARNLMVAAAAMFAVLGAVSILSIGIGFLLAAVLATVATTRFKEQSEVGSRNL